MCNSLVVFVFSHPRYLLSCRKDWIHHRPLANIPTVCMEEDNKLVAEAVADTTPENQPSTEAQAENTGDSKEV